MLKNGLGSSPWRFDRVHECGLYEAGFGLAESPKYTLANDSKGIHTIPHGKMTFSSWARREMPSQSASNWWKIHGCALTFDYKRGAYPRIRLELWPEKYHKNANCDQELHSEKAKNPEKYALASLSTFSLEVDPRHSSGGVDSISDCERSCSASGKQHTLPPA